MKALDIALAHAANGHAVFAVPLPTKVAEGKYQKHPFGGSRGHLDATTDPAAVRALFKGRRASVAIALPDGGAVLDEDAPGAFERAGISVPAEAIRVSTPRPGIHRYVRVPLGTRGTTGPDWDLKADGGWVMAPGAVAHDGATWDGPVPLPPIDHWPMLDGASLAVLKQARSDSSFTENLALPEVPEHRRNDVLKDHAWHLAEVLAEPEVLAAVRAINENRCSPPLDDREVNTIVRHACRRRERVDLLRAPKVNKIGHKPGALVTVNARDLIAHPPEAPVEIVSGLVPAGLSLLASAPKVGKSWLAYQTAVAVAQGGEVLAQQASKGDVLYLALEDGQFRAWSRITSILKRTTGRADMRPDAADLEVAFLAGRGDELVEQVEEWLARHPDAAMVLIDTLQKVRPGSSGRRNQYELDVEDVGRILEITKRHPRIGLQIVHHDTKASRAPGSDFVDAVSGTSGIGGSVDSILVLRRQRHETTGTLDVTGKDIREALHHLSYDGERPFWSIDPLGGLTDEQKEVIEWLKHNGPAGPSAIGEGLGIDKSNVHRRLSRLVELGLARKAGKGLYRTHIYFKKADNDDNTHNTDNSDNGDNDDHS